MFGMRMLGGNGAGGPVPVAADRTPTTDGVLCAVLAAHHLPDAVSGHIAHSAHVPVQLGQSGECIQINMRIGFILTVIVYSLLVAERLSVFERRTVLHCGRLAASAYGPVRGVFYVGSAAHERHAFRIRGKIWKFFL